MDIVAHGLWTFVAVYVLSLWKPTANYFDTTKKKLAAVVAASAIDLLFIPQLFYFVTHFSGRNFPGAAPQFPQWMLTWYYINHNYFFIVLVAIIIYFTRLKPYVSQITFALLMHITIDIFTHKGFFELRPFWPIQQTSFSGLVSWGEPTFFRWTWTLLLISLALVFFYIRYAKRRVRTDKFKKEQDRSKSSTVAKKTKKTGKK